MINIKLNYSLLIAILEALYTYTRALDRLKMSPKNYSFTNIIYIFTNLISTSIHGTRKKKRTRDKSISNHRPGKKEKLLVKKKEKANLVRPLEKKSRDTQSVGQKKTKTFRDSCNATITRVLNTSGANYKISYLYIYIFKLIIYIYIYIYKHLSRGWPEGSIFNSYNTEVYWLNE